MKRRKFFQGIVAAVVMSSVELGFYHKPVIGITKKEWYALLERVFKNSMQYDFDIATVKLIKDGGYFE